MSSENSDACIQVNFSDEDILKAMSEIPGHLDISLGDFKEIYTKAYEQAIKRFTREIRLSEIMTREVVSLYQDDTLEHGAMILARKNVSGAPVIDADSRVVGVVSEKDFFNAAGVGGIRTVMELIAECLSGTRCIVSGLRKGLVREIMRKPPFTASPETSAHELADIFVTRNINRAPIINENGILIGIVSRTDLVRSTLRRP
jgi:CBS domain-containing protein